MDYITNYNTVIHKVSYRFEMSKVSRTCFVFNLVPFLPPTKISEIESTVFGAL